MNIQVLVAIISTKFTVDQLENDINVFLLSHGISSLGTRLRMLIAAA